MPAGASSLVVAAERVASKLRAGTGKVSGTGGSVELDYHSSLETAARWAISIGLAGFASVALVGPHPHPIDLSNPASIVFLALAIAGALVALTLEDIYVFDAADRKLYRRRSVLGFERRRPVADLEGFAAIGTAKIAVAESRASSRTATWEPTWLVLIGRDGAVTHLGDAAGGTSRYSPKDLERIATRAAEATGLQLRLNGRAQLGWWAVEKARIWSRIILWATCVCVASAFVWDNAADDREVVLVALVPVTFAVLVVLYWWLVPLPARLSEPIKTDKDNGLGAKLAAFLFSAGALACLPWVSHQTFLHARALLVYESAPCDIVDARLQVHHGSKNKKSYEVTFRFRWQAGGRQYETIGCDLDGWHFWFEWTAQSALEEFPKGSRARCWYDPAAPGSAVLDRSISFTTLACLLFCLFVAHLVTEWALALCLPADRTSERRERRRGSRR